MKQRMRKEDIGTEIENDNDKDGNRQVTGNERVMDKGKESDTKTKEGTKANAK